MTDSAIAANGTNDHLGPQAADAGNGTLPLPPEKKHTGLFGRLFGRK